MYTQGQYSGQQRRNHDGNHARSRGPQQRHPGGAHAMRSDNKQRDGIEFWYLKQLQERSDEEILLALAYPMSGLSHELSVNLSKDRERASLVLQLVVRALRCNTMNHLHQTLISTLRGTDLIADNCLSQFISTMMVANKVVHSSANIFENILKMCDMIVTACPSAYQEILTVFLTIKAVLNQSVLEYQLRMSCRELENSLAVAQVSMRRGNKVGTADEDYMILPNSFEQLSLLPELDDIHPLCDPFVRANKDSGRFKDLGHYLDIQFRLLREDFMSPLRKGIQQYLQQKRRKVLSDRRITDVNMYHDVHILGPISCDRCVGYRLQFDVSELHINWSHSKRLISGSLVCLSNDDFSSIHCATVVGRDVDDLERGEIDVVFEDPDSAAYELDPSEVFTMAESSAFYEAYRHVLHGLQVIRRRDQLPFYKYIVECQTTIDPPKYLTAGTMYDFSTILPPSSRAHRVVQAFPATYWPSAEQLKFDSLQHDALRAGLQHEFALIQGPPGTGKTFIGLKIAQMLLRNKAFSGPILVVCFTNHALDQFLEGILSFQREGIVRVGGRSKSEKLSRFCMKVLRRDAKAKAKARKEGKKQGYEIAKLRGELKQLEEKFESMMAEVHVVVNNIVNLRTLSSVMSGVHSSQLRTIAVQSHGKVMAEWLGYGSSSGWFPRDMYKESATAKEYRLQSTENSSRQSEEPEEGVAVEDEVFAIQAQRWLDVNEEDEMKRQNLAELREHLREEAGARMIEVVDHVSTAMLTGKSNVQWHAQGQQVTSSERGVQDVQPMSEAEASRVRNVRSLQRHDRMRLYRYWTKKYVKTLRQQMPDILKRCEAGRQWLSEVYNLMDMKIMEGAAVIGMTTTGAARYHDMLQVIGPKVVIVEEAAEVLESHIITALNPSTQHLILIGDHKQLRPSHAEYDLRKHHIDLSLFERMINNRLQHVCLLNQHRMRPEISILMQPIYPGLRDDPSVLKFEKIKGIEHDMFFIDHDHPETFNPETHSRANDYEAKYAACLCWYLLQQGYERQQITVLTTYSGQLLKLRKHMPRSKFQGVRVCVVDGYQGEESDIIILSLVRSNLEGNMGFLSIENRVCVALSRARKGFYVLGNFQLLSTVRLWKNILQIVDRAGFRGPSLRLRCQNHPYVEGVLVTTVEDFKKVETGGCTRRCDFRLDCSHRCQLKCHMVDRDHINVKCKEPCKKRCRQGHQCPEVCWKDCPKCKVPVEKELPGCGHTRMIACSLDPAQIRCPTVVEKEIIPCGHTTAMACSDDPSRVRCRQKCKLILPCRHRCAKPCGDEHTVLCKVLTKFRLPCKHEVVYECHKKNGTISCESRCTLLLPCEHQCHGTCGQCSTRGQHIPCLACVKHDIKE